MQPASPPGGRSPAPAVWPVLVAYPAAFFLAQGAGAAFVFAAGIARVRGDWTRVVDEATKFALSPNGLLGGALVVAVVLAGVTLAAARLMGPEVAARLRLGPTPARPLGIAVAVVGMAGLSLACGAATDLAGVGRGSVVELSAHVLERASLSRTVLAIVTLGLAPGLAEEGFFRGLIQTRLGARFGRWPAILVTAFAFGLFHVDPVQGSAACVLGIFLGWVAERFGGIRPSVAAHAINNAAFVVLASQGASGESPSRSVALGILVGGAVTCAGAIAFLRSSRAVRGPVTAPVTASTPAS